MNLCRSAEPELASVGVLSKQEEDGMESRLGQTVAYPSELGSSCGLSEGSEADGCSELDLLVGERLGQYRLDELVGRGSMGRVYRAHHLGLERPCAIKVMNPALVERQPQIQERFWAEARAGREPPSPSRGHDP